MLLKTLRTFTSVPLISLRMMEVPALDCIKSSILFRIASDKGILMVSSGLATLRMSWSLMCSILMLSVLGAWGLASRLMILFWAIPGREKARRRRVVIVSS